MAKQTKTRAQSGPETSGWRTRLGSSLRGEEDRQEQGRSEARLRKRVRDGTEEQEAHYI